MTTIITPIAAGDAYDDVKAALVSLAEFWLGSGASSGGNTPVTWADIRTSLNAIATVLGVDTISNGDGGAAARAKINAINDLATLPSIGDLLTRFTTPASDDRAKLIGKLIYNLKDGGVWTKLDVLYLTAAADAQVARQNWIADIYNLTAVNSPTHTADRGYTGNGSSAYLDTGFNATTASTPKFVQNSAHVSAWNRTVRAGADTSIMGARQSTTNYIDLVPRVAAGSFIGRLNSGPIGLAVVNANSNGHFVVNRSGATALTGYRNGASITTSTTASSAPPNANVVLLARSLAGSSPDAYSSDQIASASIGASLSHAEAAAFYAAINTYLTAIGAA